MNRVTLFGRLGRDPELRQAGNSPVCNFSLATSEKWKDKGGESQERTEWHSIVVWGAQAEHCARYLAKGSQALIEGRIQSREYTYKEGNKRTAVDIVASHVTFVGSKPEGRSEGAGGSHSAPQGSGGRGGNWDNEDIPF